MWINRKRYDELVRAEARAELLVARVNQLEHEKADAVFQLTGKPQRAMELKIAATRLKPKHPAALDDMDSGVVDFNDMGDAAAKVEGLAFDEDGRVQFV